MSTIKDRATPSAPLADATRVAGTLAAKSTAPPDISDMPPDLSYKKTEIVSITFLFVLLGLFALFLRPVSKCKRSFRGVPPGAVMRPVAGALLLLAAALFLYYVPLNWKDAAKALMGINSTP
jgi:H+/Cl- antiporter ClcA